MAEHTLEDGKRWIANLLKLGAALGYLVDPEHNVAQEGEPHTPVDVAWLRSSDDRFPLFLFEVESRPGAQLGGNAIKVFAQDTRLFEKPLFHFHAVLDGGDSSNRVKNTQALFGTFNYRIYPDAAISTGTEMVKDILGQHRRISSTIDIPALAGALDSKTWPELDLDEIWLHAEACDFRAPWEQAYAELGAGDTAFLARLGRRLEDAMAAGDHITSEPGPGPIATAWAPLLHLALLAAMKPELGTSCLKAARRRQGEGAEADRRIAPAYGRSAAHDDLVYAVSPALWAALAAALDDPAATTWVLEQLELVLGPAERPTRPALSALSAVWMLHISRAGGDQHRAAFARAAAHLDAAGGIAPAIWLDPPGQGGLMGSLDEWTDLTAADAEPAPTWDELEPPLAFDQAQARGELVAEFLGVVTGRQTAVAGAAVRAALWASSAGAPASAAPAPAAPR
jgi:hypothetical protein